MKPDRTRRRPNIVVGLAATLLALTPAATLHAADGERFGSDGRRVRFGGPPPAAGRRPIRHLRFAGGGGRDLCRRSKSRQRDRALGEASLHFRRRQRPDEHFRFGQGRAKNCGRSGLRRPRRRRVVDCAQHRHPPQRNSRAHGRGQDHPHGVCRVRRRGPEGGRYRLRLRQRLEQFLLPRKCQRNPVHERQRRRQSIARDSNRAQIQM